MRLPVIKQRRVDEFSLGALFFLLILFLSVPYCGAVTIEALYVDTQGTGFNDTTRLTEGKRTLFGDNGNNASTLGQARRNAFEHAARLLENRLPGPNTIRVEVSFIPFKDETTIAGAVVPQIFSFPPPELLHIGYPPALAERIAKRELIDESAPHFTVGFSRDSNFYYGFTGEPPPSSIDFVTLALHEFIHGLGFHSSLKKDGSFPSVQLNVRGAARNYSRYVEQWQRIYDVQMYSEGDGEFIVDLEPQRREQAVTSDTGLLWDGTERPGRENSSCSYGQRMAELKSAGVASDGKPRLHAPPTFDEGSSITHVHTEADDIMEYLYPFPRDLDLSLGMLKDLGWEVVGKDFPPSCVPTGVSVTPTSGLVTTEGGGVATFTVGLDSEPMSDVIIPLRSSEPQEGVADTAALEFTPDNWAAAQTVRVTGVNDREEDGPKRYVIALEMVQSRDRFYDGFNPDDVSVTNQDNDPEPDPVSQEGGGGGCALAMEKRVENSSGNTVLNLFLIAAFLFSATLGRSPLGGKRHFRLF